jgi:hypothetical protein
METMAKTYPPGVPCWIDVTQQDTEATKTFYGGLFGWTFEDLLPEHVPGSYWVASLDGAVVGAVGMPGPSPQWHTYVSVDDIEAACASVVRLGGRAEEPEVAGPAGTSAVCTDPHGVEIRLWQPGYRAGAELVNAPGSWNFSDLHTDDRTGAASFYGALFGWELDDFDGSGMWRRPGYGAHLGRSDGPGEPPGFSDCIGWLADLSGDEVPHWHVTFSVADRDESLARALELGAEQAGPLVDNEWVHSVDIRDPQGACLTLSQFDPQQ